MAKENKNKPKDSKENMSLTISYPNLKLNLSTDNPLSCLKELKKIVEALNQNTEILDRISDEMASLENPEIVLNMEFSEDVRSNPDIVEHIDKLMQVEPAYKVYRTHFACKKIVDIDNKHTAFEIETKEAEKNINRIFSDVNNRNVNYTILLLKGEFTSKDKYAIIEKFKKYLPHSKLKAYTVKEPMFGKIAAEILFFGDV